MCAVCKNVFIAELVYLPVSNLLSIRNRIEWDRVGSRKEERKEGLSPSPPIGTEWKQRY